MTSLDEHLWLCGSEDCDVDVQCRTCDRRGEPVVWYAAVNANPYDEARVPTARTIPQLYELMERHVRDMHGQ